MLVCCNYQPALVSLDLVGGNLWKEDLRSARPSLGVPRLDLELLGNYHKLNPA